MPNFIYIIEDSVPASQRTKCASTKENIRRILNREVTFVYFEKYTRYLNIIRWQNGEALVSNLEVHIITIMFERDTDPTLRRNSCMQK